MASSHYDRAQKPIYQTRHLKVICIGAGASGLLLAYKLQRSFEHFDLTIYEKNEGVAGTWFENTYPGCACDIAAHAYTYSFEPHADWSSVYAGSDEIRQYFESFCAKYRLSKYIKLKHQVTAAVWNTKQGRWDVDITNLDNGSIIHDSGDILVNASGVLNAWRWPDIPGLEDYKGQLLHTANWDSSVDLNGKHVGLIGNGASGVQVLPAIAPQASKVTTFVRGPTWVAPVQWVAAQTYSDEQRQRFASDPEFHLQYRKQLETMMNKLFPMFIADSPLQKATFEGMTRMMKDSLKNKQLEDLVIPKWPVGCRRLTPGVGYLEALVSDKVKVVHGEILKVTEKGCVGADGREHPVDVLICATGFDVSFRPRFPLIGASGNDLRDVWKDEAKSYFAFAIHDFPNYFLFVGPNSPIANGPLIPAMEAQADYMLKMMDRWQTENIHSFFPKKQAVEDFIAFKDEFMKRTVWEEECSSWYKKTSASGKITALWCGSTLHYLEAMAEPRYEDWDFEYNGNRYAFFGNGLSQTESDRSADWAYYIRNEDDGPFLSRVKRIKVLSKSGTVFQSHDDHRSKL